MSKTVFEKVISGELEGSFVHKDEVCVAFMDLHPLNEGHILVVPRKAVARVTDMDSQTAAHLFLTAQKILRALENSDVKCEGANVFISDGDIAGQEVPHVHIHLVPRFTNDGLRLSFGKPFRRADREELNRVAEKIAAQMK